MSYCIRLHRITLILIKNEKQKKIKEKVSPIAPNKIKFYKNNGSVLS